MKQNVVEAGVEGPAGDMAGVTIAGEPEGGAVGRSCRGLGAEILAGDAGGGRWADPAARVQERLRAGRDAVEKG